MAFTAADVKALREITGCGMMDCKKALTETNGDTEKAIEFLREKGLATAEKKSGRIAADGIVHAEVTDGIGILLEVNSETDFVAKNADFQQFVADVATQIKATSPASVEALLEEKFVGGDETISAMLVNKIATIGENLTIRRFERYEGVVETYIHGGGKIGVMVKFTLGDAAKADTAEFKEFAHDIAMQVAASNPQYLDRASVPEEVVSKETEILTAQAMNEGKPQAIAEKMVAGRINKYFKEICLVDQAYIKDGDMTVTTYAKSISDKIGTEIKIDSFARFEKGEGIEKKEDNFAEEIANMVK
ncbi:MAG: elongation factor Ts [Clostridia bacterium]|nr:elongation factor Ts [Clostridia bacterium]